MNYLRFGQPKLGSFSVVCAREGGVNTTPFQVSHFALRTTKNKTGGNGPHYSGFCSKKLEFQPKGTAKKIEKV